MEIQRKENETNFEWKLRLIKLKLIDKEDIEWQEIVDILELDCSADHLRKTAYGILEYDNYLKNNGVATRILSISDSHVPFNLPLEIFKDFVGNVDILQLNGDIFDMQAISRFPKSYRVSVMEEIIQGRQYIIDLIEYIKPKKVSINYGNHEVRFQSYLSKNLDSDLLELMPKTVLDLIVLDGFNHYDKRNKTKVWYEPLNKVFDDIEIEYTENWYSQIGQTIFCHPTAFSSDPLKTAIKATNWFRNEGFNFTSLIMAHTHRIGDYKVGSAMVYEQGACCDTKKQHYTDGKLVNSQKEGFIYICQDDAGKIIDSKTQLIHLN
jgi:predicted phosphodiesterase